MKTATPYPLQVHCTSVNTPRTFVTMLLASVVWLFLTACSEPQLIAEVSTPYYHSVIASRLQAENSYQVERQFSGRVVSKQQANLNFEVAGRVAKIYVDDGDNVTTGQLLASLDTQFLTIQKQQLTAQLAQVNAQLELTKRNLSRSQALSEQNYASAQLIDELSAQQHVLQAQWQQIQAQIAGNQYHIEHANLYAPFAGTVNRRMISVGEVINANQVALQLSQLSHMEVKVGVPLTIAKQLQNQPANSRIFTLRIGAQTVHVNSVKLNSDINANSRSIQARFALPDDIDVYHNQLAYLVFSQTFNQPGYWVPISALTDGVRGTWNVYTLEAEVNDLYRVNSHSVDVIHTTTEQAYVRGDLPNQQPLLQAGLQRIVPGQLVRIKQQHRQDERAP